MTLVKTKRGQRVFWILLQRNVILKFRTCQCDQVSTKVIKQHQFYKTITFTTYHFQGFFKGSVKYPIIVPKTQETLRKAQTNYEKGLDFKITSEKLLKKGLRACSPPNP